MRKGAQQTVQKQHIHHGHFVYNHGICFQRILLVTGKDKLSGMRINSGTQQAVDGGSLLPGHFRQPFGCPTSGRCQKTTQSHLPIQGENSLDDGCFTGTGAAGDQQKTVVCRIGDRLRLLFRIGQLAVQCCLMEFFV